MSGRYFQYFISLCFGCSVLMSGGDTYIPTTLPSWKTLSCRELAFLVDSTDKSTLKKTGQDVLNHIQQYQDGTCIKYALFIKGSYLQAQGNYQEALSTLIPLRKDDVQTDPDYAMRLDYKLGSLYTQLANYTKAIEHFKAVLESKSIHSNPMLKGKAYSAMTGTYRQWGLYDEGIKTGYQALVIQDSMKDLRNKCFTLDRLGVIYKLKNNTARSLQLHQQALAIRETQFPDDKKNIAYSLFVLGDLYQFQNRSDSAWHYLHRAIQIYQNLKDQSGLAYAYANLGNVSNHLGQYNQSISFATKAIQLFDSLEDKKGKLPALFYLTNALISQSKYSEATTTNLEFKALALELNSKKHIADAAYNCYRIYKTLGNSVKALHCFEEYHALSDTLFHQEHEEELRGLENSYQNAGIHQELQLAREKEKKNLAEVRQQHLLNLLIALAGMFLGIIALFYYLAGKVYQKQKRKLIKQNEIITNQNWQLDSAQKELEESYKTLESKVHERTQELQLSNEKLEQYAYLASHDLKQPLRTISGFVQLLQRDLVKSEMLEGKRSEYMHFILNSVQHMHELIDRTLNFSKAEKGQLNSNDQFRIREVVEEVCQLLHHQIENSNAQIRTIDNSGYLQIEKWRILVILQNLISNAIRFSKEGEQPNITVQSDIIENQLNIEVKDNGIGIDQVYQSKIFDTFTQLNSKSKFGGTGLGLSICKKLVSESGGTIQVESTPGSGSTFKIQLKN